MTTAISKTDRATEAPASVASTGGFGSFLDRLEKALPAIRQAATNAGAGDPPLGYDDLFEEDRAIADECWENGLNAMQTEIANWIYDQRHNEPNQRGDRMTTATIDVHTPPTVPAVGIRSSDWLGWIDIATRRPAYQQRVLALISNDELAIHNVECIAWNAGDRNVPDYWFTGIPGDYIQIGRAGFKVTHWQPLPNDEAQRTTDLERTNQIARCS